MQHILQTHFRSTPASTILHPPWLNVSRALWLLITIAVFTLSNIGLYRALSEPLPECSAEGSSCAPWSVSREDIELAQREGLPDRLLLGMYFLGGIFPKYAFGLVGLLIFWRRSQDWIAQLLAMMLVLFALEGITKMGALQPLVDVLYAGSIVIFSVLPFIFPNGRYVPRWTRWVALPLALVTAVLTFAPQLGISDSDAVYAVLLLAPFLAWFLLSVYAVLYRFRFVSSPTERQQIKWTMAGILASFLLFIPFSLITVYFPPSQPSTGRILFILFVHYPVYLISYLAIPGGVAFAILRYRLWDIDLIIRRTLQYAILTGVLALVYFGGVVVLQAILGPLLGRSDSPMVTVITTLGSVAIFSPLRLRIQAFIDRRFYRRKYDAEKALENFAVFARDEVDLFILSGSLLGIVEETMQPQGASLWLK